jgi:hypothetical protein
MLARVEGEYPTSRSRRHHGPASAVPGAIGPQRHVARAGETFGT